ncbi:hypothetical protein SISNIDRAFT_451774 [Sistotremastrum niveocremeum HHB9708]|uniref:CSC1/OSCA1-like 7TM region domain-containing protein n=1 Tax=Sistotremastrum niveocremeum HHB9708 TaxID=1314777 RepID=A0A164XLD8_9AGAM|nr:hypothetical protein SISNIDRAFT_451774 [Sistotremastrum niveocremeum HHB9708]
MLDLCNLPLQHTSIYHEPFRRDITSPLPPSQLWWTSSGGSTFLPTASTSDVQSTNAASGTNGLTSQTDPGPQSTGSTVPSQSDGSSFVSSSTVPPQTSITSTFVSSGGISQQSQTSGSAGASGDGSSSFTTLPSSTSQGGASSTSGVTSPTFTPASSSNGSLASLDDPPVCIGQGVDAQALGILSCLLLSSLIGFALWILFAILRPRFRQLYGVREWFVRPELRPEPLSNRFWAFLFPPLPFIPKLPNDVSDAGSSEERDAELFPSDQELNQRTLWNALLLAAGWTILGLAGALPLYLVNTPCLAQSSPQVQFGGQLSTLQDLSLLRLLTLLDDRSVTTSNMNKRFHILEVLNGKDERPSVNTRLIILTALVLAVGVLPALIHLGREFSRLAAYRKRWLQIKCDNLEIGWLSAQKAPGFSSWGEVQLKEFIFNTGLSKGDRLRASDPQSRRSRSRRADIEQGEEERGGDISAIDVQSLFTITDLGHLCDLITERDVILNHLEMAETRYIASFKLSTPDPSIMDIDQMALIHAAPETPNEGRPFISRPRALGGSQRHRRRQPPSRIAPAVPTSYVAPSSYYRLRNFSRTDSQTASLSEDRSFGDRVHSRVIGSRFQELNRDSRLLPAVPYGSIVHLGKAGELEPVHETVPDPSRYGPNYSEEPSSSAGVARTPDDPRQWKHPENISDYEMVDIPPSSELTPNEGYDRNGSPAAQGETEGLVRPRPPRTNVSSSARETFAMRGPSEDPSTTPPPHLRLQLQPPFVRPLSGLAHEQLTAIYDDIRHWRSRLKAANKEIADLQNDIYTNIADGTRIKGWLLTGRGIRFIPGIKMIDGRSKNDIKWHELQREGGNISDLGFWITATMVSILAGALLMAIAGLAVAGAPNVSHYLTFFGPLANHSLGAALATTLAPAILGTMIIVAALAIINYASRFGGSISVSHTQLNAFRATFCLLVIISTIWLVAVGALIFSLRSFDLSNARTRSVANGSIYMAAFLLAVLINLAIIAPALLLLQPVRLWSTLRHEKSALTPRQRFRAIYPAAYNPSVATGCCVLAMVFASMFSVIFPLIGPPVVLLLFLALVAHRYLVGYVYGRVHAGQTGGLTQMWLVRRFGTLLCLQPLLLGLILLAYRFWTLGGVLVGCGVLIILVVELFTWWRSRLPGIKTLNSQSREALDIFRRAARSPPNVFQSPSNNDEVREGSARQRTRSRGSLASVLDMMSITLAVAPSSGKRRRPVPLANEDIDDLVATERAARTHPDAPPHLPFVDPSEEMVEILYAPELLAPPPTIWLPNDTSGVARQEAHDLQRYHDLNATLDVRASEDVLPPQIRRSTSRRRSSG